MFFGFGTEIRSSYCWLRRPRRNEGLLKPQVVLGSDFSFFLSSQGLDGINLPCTYQFLNISTFLLLNYWFLSTDQIMSKNNLQRSKNHSRIRRCWGRNFWEAAAGAECEGEESHVHPSKLLSTMANKGNHYLKIQYSQYF